MTREYDDFSTSEGAGKGLGHEEGFSQPGLDTLWEWGHGLADSQWEIRGGGCSGSASRQERRESGSDKPAWGNGTLVDHLLRGLVEKDLAGKGHLERHLRHKYRQHLAASTLRNTLCIVSSFLGFLEDAGGRLEELTRGDLEGFIEHEQDRDLKASTVNARMKVVKAFVRFLIDQGVVDSEVLSRRLTIKVAEGLPRAIPPEDIRRLLGVIEDVRDRAMVMVLLRTGMRIGELLHTRVEDVLMEERKILIFEPQKNRLGRVVYLSDDAVEALQGWLERRDPQKVSLFYARGKEGMSYGTARKMFYTYLVRAGLADKGYSLHCLRHSFATGLLNAGMRLECLQVLLGHSDLEMTRRYAKLTDKTREEQYFRAMEKILKEENDVCDELDRELQALFEEEEFLDPHGEEVPEQP